MSGGQRPRDETDVRVTGGTVRGVREGGVLAWRGIPYAAAPIGGLRFTAPMAVVPWNGLRGASQFGAVAPQRFSTPLARVPTLAVDSSEDCLTVNVHAPAADVRGTALLPVMVFIHGGGYSGGSSRDFSGQGEGFVRSGRVVYVSFNYRLGPFGYLDFSRYSTAQRSFDSNLGLRDQVAVLRWVRENIGGFGGDAGNVTVFGESAGANAVTTLLATPAARGLITRAIAQSSPSNAVYRPATTARWAGEFVAILRDIVAARAAFERVAPRGDGDGDGAGEDGDGDGDRSIELGAGSTQQLLSTALVDDLIAASATLQVRTPDAYPGAFCLAPVVDGVFLPESPMRAFRDGRAHRVPLIIGTNDREGSIFRGRVDILPRTPERIEALFARAPAGSRQGMRDAYPGLPERRAAADFGGDYGFWYPSTRVADFHSRHAPVWCYRFDFAPRLLKLAGLDATHGVEMFALFGRTDLTFARVITSLGGNEAYAAAGSRMRELWLRFAEAGSPSDAWIRYDERVRPTLVIDDADRIESDPRRRRRRAWNRFLPGLAG